MEQLILGSKDNSFYGLFHIYISATATTYKGGFEFKDAVKQADEYIYDANDNLTKNLTQKITVIRYHCLKLSGRMFLAEEIHVILSGSTATTSNRQSFR